MTRSGGRGCRGSRSRCTAAGPTSSAPFPTRSARTARGSPSGTRPPGGSSTGCRRWSSTPCSAPCPGAGAPGPCSGGEKHRRRGPAAGSLPEPAAETVLPPRRSGPEGISVIGWATAPTGVGEACRGTLSALYQAEIPCALWTLDGRADGAPGAACEEDRQGLPYEPLLFHVNADMMETVQSRIPSSLHLGRHRIGYWFWELSHFPLGLAGAFECVDEVWAPTRFCLESFRAVSPVEVRWVPPCVVPTEAVPADRADAGGEARRVPLLLRLRRLERARAEEPRRPARGLRPGGPRHPRRRAAGPPAAQGEPRGGRAGLRRGAAPPRPRGCRSPCSPARSAATP